MKKSDLKEGAAFYVQNANGGIEPSIFGGIISSEVKQLENGSIYFDAKDICDNSEILMCCTMTKNGDVVHGFSYRPLEPTLREAFIDGMEELAHDRARAESLMESVKERQETWMSGREFPSNPENDGKSLLKPMRR